MSDLEATGPGGGPPSALGRLLALQDEDIRIDQLRHRRRHLPEQVALDESLAKLGQLDRARADLGSDLDALNAQADALEHETADVIARIAAIEERSRSGAVASYRDQEAMAIEIGSLAARRAELEEHELEFLVQSEPLDAEIAASDERRTALEHERLEAETAVLAAASAIEAELAVVQARRSELAAAVAPELLATYERLRTRLDGVGVARLVRTMCSGCHLTLPATEIDRLHHAPEGTIAFCEQCGRILVP